MSNFDVNPEFVKDFRFSFNTNAGGSKQVLALTSRTEIKRRLDFVVNANYAQFRRYHPERGKAEYQLFWSKFLSKEIAHYKTLPA